MDTVSKTTKAILKLTKDTIERKINWLFGSKARIKIGGEEEIIDNVYCVKYYNKNLRIYRYRYKDYYDYLEYTWGENYRLEIVDENDNSLWEFPSDHAIVGLYEVIKEKTSGANNFIDKILEED